MFKKYFDTVVLVLVRPILFYAKLPAGDFKDEPVTFCSITSWILAFFLSLVIFINQLVPVGLTLWEGITGIKLIIVFPVMTVLAFMFFVIVYTIIGGAVMTALLSLSCILGYLLYLSSRMMGGKGDQRSSVKAALYGSAVFLIEIFAILIVLLSKRGILDFTNFKIGYNIVYSFAVLYLYGVLAIAARKTHGIERWKAFMAALLPILFLVILGFAVNWIVLPKMANWIV